MNAVTPEPTVAGQPRSDSPDSSDRPAPRAVPPVAEPAGLAPPMAQPADHHAEVVPAQPESHVLRGPAARVVANMETSLTVPTATSVRAIPAKLLIDNRVVINNHLAPRPRRQGLVHPPHRLGDRPGAARSVPAMNASYAEVDGKPTIVEPGARQPRPRDRPGQAGRHAHAARAVHQGRRDDGLRRSSGRPTRTSSAGPARNKLTADDFAGTTISLTNPGTIGTVHSVPRLMAGQGTIVGVGAMEYPAEWQGASPGDARPATRSARSLTLTSTYDHRIIQGAQSGDFLRRIHQLLLGEDGFYDEIFALPADPVRAGALGPGHRARPRRRRRQGGPGASS